MIASITFIHHSRSTIHQILPPKKSMSPRRKALLKSLLVLVLLLCFGLQVWDALSKFVGRRTTLVSTTERLEEAELPVVSFCPGYKDDVHYYDNLEELQRVLNQSTSEEREDPDFETDVLEEWEKATYDFHEVVPFIKGMGLNWEEIPETRITETGNYKDIQSTIQAIHSTYGRCYSIVFNGKVTEESQYFTIKFNLEHFEDLHIYVMKRHNDIGLVSSFFPEPPFVMSIRAHDAKVVSAQFDTFKPLLQDDESEVPCNDSKNFSYPKCVSEWIRKEYREVFRRNNRTVCWYPGGQALVNDTSSIPFCNSAQDDAFAREHIFAEVVELSILPWVTKCPRRCTRSVLNVEVATEPDSLLRDNGAYVFVFNKMSSNHEEEILMYDFNTIVASTGGSLGLFLGVSCFSVFTYLGKKFSGVLE